MSISPLFHSPFTDLMYILGPNTKHYSHDPTCVKIESKFLDCMEAYGTLRVKEKCAELLYDLTECSTHTAQIQRAEAIRKERMKQYREGKLAKPFEENPPLDPYLSI